MLKLVYDCVFVALAMQIDKHSIGYVSYHGGIRSIFSTQIVRDTGLYLYFKVN